MQDLTQQKIRFEDEAGEDVIFSIVHFFTDDASGETFIFAAVDEPLDDDEFEDILPYRVSLDEEGWIDDLFPVEDDKWELVQTEWERFEDEEEEMDLED